MDEKCNLILLLTLTAFFDSAAEDAALGTAPTVRGWKGEDIRLRCDIQELQPVAVMWVKESLSYQQPGTIKAGFFDGDFESREERFGIAKDFSLVVTNLEVGDEGRYYCQVVLENSEIFEKYTFMTVSSMASKHVIEECVDTIPSNRSRCTRKTSADSQPLNLTCIVSGFKPNISLLWTWTSGQRLNSTVSRQTTLSDETYERVETITVSANHGTEQTLMCIATGDSLNGTSIEEITLLPIISGRHGLVGVIIGLVIGLSAAVSICLLGKFLQNHHPDYLPRKGCGWNPCWRRPQKRKRFDETEESMLASSPRSKSLTEEQVKQCKQDLQDYYCKTRRKVTLNPLIFTERVSLDDIYTNLSIIDKTDLNKTPITYEDLLTNDENGPISKHVLIQGEGGVGKTTLCSKIAWDWCQGRILQDMDLVIVIPLRDVTDGKSIGAIMERYLSDSNEATSDQMDDYISTHLSKILLIFDGFDEFNREVGENNSSEVIDILALKQYKSCKIIVTTRPWKTHGFRMDKRLAEAYTFMSVEGFNEENLSAYIRRFFRSKDNSALAENLICFIEDNDIIHSNMAPFPIYCAMLCLMWNDFSEERRQEIKKLQTFSEIFGAMISFLKEHYVSKICEDLQKQTVVDHLKRAGTAIQEISKIALKGLFQNDLSFPEERFRKCRNAMETCCRVGVLTIEKDVITRERRHDVNTTSLVESVVSFPHKLFQEYVAGVYVENVYGTDCVKYGRLKSKLLTRFEEFRYILYFASALGRKLALDIIKTLTKKGDQYFCVDVAFEGHSEEAARIVGKRWHEYTLSYDMSEHTKSGVVFMVQCNQAKSLSLDRVNCGQIVSRDLAEAMCSSRTLRKVSVTSSKLHTDFYKIIGDKAVDCQVQDLTMVIDEWNDNSHQSWIGKDLAHWVCIMPCLSSLTLECYYMADDFYQTAAKFALNCQIKDLTLITRNWRGSFEYMSSVGGYLAQWICTMPRLSNLSVDCYYLPDNFFSNAADLAQSCQIRDLMLIYNLDCSFQEHSIVGGDLAQWVCTTPRLSNFSVKCYNLHHDFFSIAADLAQSCQISELTMGISTVCTSPKVATDFAKFLCNMPHLTRANITCPTLPSRFFTEIASQAARSKIAGITINGMPLIQMLSDK